MVEIIENVAPTFQIENSQFTSLSLLTCLANYETLASREDNTKRPVILQPK